LIYIIKKLCPTLLISYKS